MRRIPAERLQRPQLTLALERARAYADRRATTSAHPPDPRPQMSNARFPEPALEPLDGWTALGPQPFFFALRSFVSDDPRGERIRIGYFRKVADDSLAAKVWFGPGAEGPPGHAHGGSLAAVLDEGMGYSCWMAGHPVVAASIRVDYRRVVPLGVELCMECGVLRTEGRKVIARGRLFDADGTNYAESEGLFVALPGDRWGAMDSVRREQRGDG